MATGTASGPRLCVASAGAGKAVGPSMPIAQQISLAIDHAFDERAVIVRSQGPKLSVFCGQRRHIDVLPSRAGCGASARSSHGDDRGLSSPTDVPLSGKKFSEFLANRPPIVLRNQVGARGTAYWFRVRISEKTREGATELCTKLRSRGGSCLVVRN